MVNAVRLTGGRRLHGYDRKRILRRGWRYLSLKRTDQKDMYRVIAIAAAGFTLAACSSTPDWMSLDALKPAPIMDTVRLESTPPGADAKAASGETCRTPCALALPANTPTSITFTLNGYLPEAEDLQPIAASNGLPELRPNPVAVELTPAPPPPKPVKKPVRKKPTTAKPPAKPKPKPKAKPKTTTAPAPAPAAPAQQPAASPWPATPPPKQ